MHTPSVKILTCQRYSGNDHVTDQSCLNRALYPISHTVCVNASYFGVWGRYRFNTAVWRRKLNTAAVTMVMGWTAGIIVLILITAASPHIFLLRTGFSTPVHFSYMTHTESELGITEAQTNSESQSQKNSVTDSL